MKTRLLIAETDAELRRIYQLLPAAWGFEAQTAGNPLECCTLLGSQSFDAIVIDAEIFRKGGCTLREGMNCCAHRLNGLALFATGDDGQEALSARLGIPVGHCFQKPFRVRELLDVIRAVVDEQSGKTTEVPEEREQESDRTLPNWGILSDKTA